MDTSDKVYYHQYTNLRERKTISIYDNWYYMNYDYRCLYLIT